MAQNVHIWIGRLLNQSYLFSSLSLSLSFFVALWFVSCLLFGVCVFHCHSVLASVEDCHCVLVSVEVPGSGEGGCRQALNMANFAVWWCSIYLFLSLVLANLIFYLLLLLFCCSHFRTSGFEPQLLLMFLTVDQSP